MRAEQPTPFPIPLPTPLPIPDPRPDPTPGPAPDPEPRPEPRPEPTPGPTPDAVRARRAARRATRRAAAVLAAAGLAACGEDEEEAREREAQRLARVGERVARIERLNNAAYGLCLEALQGMLLLQPRAAVARREEVDILRGGDTLIVRGWMVADTTSTPLQRRGWTCTIPARDTTLTRAQVQFDR